MYRAFLYFAFLAFCLAAPYGGLNSGGSFIQQPTTIVRSQQRDETDLVDTLGAGYSFFKKQPIVSRPLVQQQLAISEQQVPITSLDDTSNQWSGYTRASAFPQQPVHLQTVSANNDLLVTGGYGQQQAIPAGFGSQQENTDVRVNLMPKTFLSQGQDAYGSSFGQVQPQVSQTVPLQQQPLTRSFDNSYGQQQDTQTIVQQPLIRNLGNSYGQQQQDLQPFVQQPLTRNLGNSYGQQQQQDSQPIVQQPLIRNLGNSYGQQQQQDLQSVVQQPLIRNFGNSYGQQQQSLQPAVQQPLIRNLGNSYGQQQQLDQSAFTGNSNNGYSQQQPDFSSVQVPQSTFSQQTDFSGGNSALIPSSRFVGQSQSAPQMADSGSNGGW